MTPADAAEMAKLLSDAFRADRCDPTPSLREIHDLAALEAFRVNLPQTHREAWAGAIVRRQRELANGSR